MLSQTGSNRIVWTAVDEWKSVQTAKETVEAVVEVCNDAAGTAAGYNEHAGKLHVHVRITPAGKGARDFFMPVPSREAGEALITEKLAAFMAARQGA